MSKHFLTLTFIAFIQMPLWAQVAIGQWRDHLPYTKGVMVADAGEVVYAASESGLFQYHKTDGDIVRLSKVSGLSDIGYAAVAWSRQNNALFIGYRNTNIDLIQDGKIINIPDIKDKMILGNKVINNIHVIGDYAYVACGFAIVVVDLVKHEVKDTYYIGAQGAVLNVFDITASNNRIFAATENGIYWASLNGPNLASFESWTRFSSIPVGKYNAATWFNDRLYVNLSVQNALDTVYYLDNDTWKYFEGEPVEKGMSLESGNGVLLVVSESNTAEYNKDHERIRLVYEYNGSFASPRHALTDAEGTMWIADGRSGLVRHASNFTSEIISVNGPADVSNTDISIWDGRCYVASGSLTSTWTNAYNNMGLYSYKNNQWTAISPFDFGPTTELRDYIRVIVDPYDSKRIYATCWGSGLAEYYDDQFVAFYDESNSPLRALEGSNGIVHACGLAIDQNTGTLWVSGSEVPEMLYAKDAAGTWYSFKIEAIGPVLLGDIAIDKSGQKWIVAPRGSGLVVYNDNGTLANTTDDRSMRLTQGVGKGNLKSNDIYAIAADLDGEIWVGTNNGISVFYSPETVLDGGNFDAQQILVEQDGYVQYLLENEAVTEIAIDGANRKWIGTANAGVFLMSEDGTKQIHHFTTTNSPLFSNLISSIGVDQLSGEVFIGTDKGIISYKSDATWGTPEFVKTDVYAYPNPVTPDYDGPIAIKGLIRNADVKIADAAGNVVFATKANGGQAIWNGNKLSGERAKSGVYLVFSSNEDGKETFVTKILFIN